jgi:radical SAM superfamily enzyme YgiQ (UPF0313 family)
MPVYISSLAAVLRKDGHTVTILEPAASVPIRGSASSAVLAEHVASAIRERKPDLVIFDVRMEYWGDFKACAMATKTAVPSARLIGGGRHASLCAEDTLRFCEALDGVMIGESEATSQAICRGMALPQVSAMAVRDGSRIFRTDGDSIIGDLDSLPFPAWDLMDMPYYTRRTPRVIPCIPMKTATLESSRGCSGQCSFCSEGRLYSKPHRFHGAGYVAEAVEHLIRDYRINGIYFSDENFAADAPRVAALCEEFIRRGLANRIRWSAQVRADSAVPDLLALMRRAGCIQLEVGIESGSQQVLDAMGKGTSVEQNRAALRMTRAAGIRTLAYIVIGLPGEESEDLLETLRFLDATDPDIVRFNPFLLYPGTPAVQRLVAEGRLRPDFWKEAQTVSSSTDDESMNVSTLSLPELRDMDRRLDRHAALPRFIRDYLAHNRPWAMASHFNGRAFLSFCWKKVRR